MPHLNHRASARRWRTLLIGSAAALALMPGLASAQDRAAAQNGAASDTAKQDITKSVQNQAPVALPSLNPLVTRVLPAVVSISAQMSPEQMSSETGAPTGESAEDDDQPSSPFDETLRRFFENRGMPQRGREVMALGSGFIIDPAGYVVTNNHVIGDSQKVTVILQDNSRHPARIIGRDEKTDLALLKVDASEKLPFVSWGDSEQSKVGDWVMAVGNPFSLGGTVTAGIISALGRDINEGPYDDFIQIDAPINRGNSGGPTFNLGGEVIGINTAIYSPSGGSVGIGFAVPSNTAARVVAQLKDKGHVTRGWLGVAVQGVTKTIARSLALSGETGAMVAAVTPNSPAAKAGIKQGDVVVTAAGHPIKSVHDLPRIVAAAPIGDKFDLTLLRDGKETTLSATIAEMPEQQPRVASANDNSDDGKAIVTGLGVQLSALTPDLRRHFRIPSEIEGVVVTRVASDSPVGAIGVEAGDVIQAIDQQPATAPQQASEQLKQAAAKGNILLLLNRRGASQFVGLSITPGVGSSRPD